MLPLLKPSIKPHGTIRLPIVLGTAKNLPHRWNQDATHHLARRFSLLSDPLDHPLRSPLPLRSRLLLPRSLVPPLLRPRPPSLRSALSSMTSAQASAETVSVVVKGRVQGVFYRDWTVENASPLGLKGWIRNRRDGSVEALFSGSHEAVQEMQQRCRRGPPAAVVTSLEAFPSNEDPGTGFGCKPTV